MSIINNHQKDFDKAVEHFISDIAALKTGRANPAVLDSIKVESYGTFLPINQLASIAVPEPRSILIQPWDKSLINNIDKAIQGSDLGLSPTNEGDTIRIVIPPMTEEARKEIVKSLHKKMEEVRIVIRSVRDEAKEEILAAEKNKKFGEDEKYNLIEKLDKITGDYNNKIKEIGEKKEKEIMTV
ncbi:MAG: ribosome recycling factor [Candidatus Buchananbacteria bacterium RIFCSPHIGHO2_02_FULL_40_13]|uniref:Ribosome-recycling factor n=1 Tax=Candidatus Buchananbacteria bacterium RIFCSPLOWO2_01_FULL_39_33 TaxID=1797543 RepID=A0A1G1YIP5_9BACT|nr:MAG: ribosome recycling factor [Candidatus Buchananbacteria bacterium RIFCSPHIGHO2_01_FULL_40_35]OGY50440.1 MAG: ribosome recycling factor [Candidatus Buchananbacteria bacterium RIFCSPHIGHO2_02_FULL_40_13]OGY51580.1 MAG: ribosome recycling factor [Candidatus Buchananbacteria bacterium RIFCSPLOWO2_01_FULL_39_33]